MVQFPTARARWLIVVLVAAAGWSIVVPVAAAPLIQTGTPIRYGDTLPGEITGEPPCQYYWFEGGAGDPVTIDMTRTSGSLDGVLTLYRQDGDNFSTDPVAFNDDRPGGGLDPLISVTLPAADWYTITACRLQAEQMRVTTGTFSLTLSGSETGATVGATPAPAANLSDTIFGGSASPTPAALETEPSAGETPANATPAPSPTTAGNLSDVIPGEQAESTPAAPSEGELLSDGSLVSGQLTGSAEVRYDLPVLAGDVVRIEWRRAAGDAAPLLRVLDSEGVTLAEAATPDIVSQLDLRFRAPAEDTLMLIVARYGDAVDGTTFGYELLVAITADAEPAALLPTPTPASEESDPAPATSDAAPPCQSGNEAVTGSADTDRVADAYTAAGDSYAADELETTTTFAADDDLNVVLSLHNLDGPVVVSGTFCSPDGDAWDGGENRLDNGGPYLLGLDWESSGVAWPSGEWFAEVYIDGALELTLGFAVE